MNREEAIHYIGKVKYKDAFEYEAMKMAIEALEGVCFDEWCTDCKEYDTEKKCCPRFNRVIRGAIKREPSEDGTLEVKVEDATKIGRVLISDDEHRGGLYYPDEYEPQSVSFENDTDNFQPSISIVRCKDCKHLYNDADTGKACEFTNLGMEPNDFCSYGERSEE